MSGIFGKKIFYGWWIVTAALICTFLEMGIGFYSYGVFYVPFEQEFGWGRAEVALGISIYTLIQGVIGFLAGRLTDSYGPKRVMLAGALAVGLSFVLRSFITDLWQLYVLQAIMGGGISALGTVPISTVIANWFVKKRGLAIGITMTGTGFGGLVIVPLAQYLITTVGWRPATAILGAVGTLLVLPLVLWVMKARPSDMGLYPDGEEPQKITATNARTGTPSVAVHGHGHVSGNISEDWTLGEALKTPTFWLLTVAFALLMMASSAVLNHEVPYLVDIGIDAQAAATALGFTAGMGVIGKLAAGVFSDRMGSRLVFALISGIQGIGVFLLLGTSNMLMVWIFVIVFGFGMGGAVTLRPMIAAEIFGVKSFGAIFGLLAGFATIGGAIGPLFAGLVFDSTKSYQIAMITFVIAYFIALVLIFLARTPKRKTVPAPERESMAPAREA